jgi:hypothetical protein
LQMSSLSDLALKAVAALKYEEHREVFVRRWSRLPEAVPDARTFGDRYCDPRCPCTYQPRLLTRLPTGHVRHLAWLACRLPLGPKQYRQIRGKRTPASLSLLAYNKILVRVVSCFVADCDLAAFCPPVLRARYAKILLHLLLADRLVLRISDPDLPLSGGCGPLTPWRDFSPYPKRLPTVILGVRRLPPFRNCCPFCEFESSKFCTLKLHVMGLHYALRVSETRERVPPDRCTYDGIEIWALSVRRGTGSRYHCLLCTEIFDSATGMSLHVFREHVALHLQ